MPGARCTRSLACKSRKHASKSPRSHRDHPAFPHAMVLTVSFALSPVTGYQIHTFRSRRVVPYFMWRKSSRPKRITFGPGFP
jgi:hypothetical protein